MVAGGIKVDPITKGLVLDHIKAGKSMDIYRYLRLSELNCSVAIIKNVKSSKYGKKDIIKIEDEIDIDYDVLGYIDPNITVNVIENGVRTDKRPLALPERITNIVSCKNPRCITSIERGIEQVFVLADRDEQIYRCEYCEQAYK